MPGGPHGPPHRLVSSQHVQQHTLAAGVPSGYYHQVPRQAPPPAWTPTAHPTPPAWSPCDPQSLANAFSTVTLTPPPNSSDWVIDSGASSHIVSNPGMITTSPSSSFPSSIVVGNGATLSVVGTRYSTLPGLFHLNNVLIAPDNIKNLLSVRKFKIERVSFCTKVNELSVCLCIYK